MLPIVNPVPRVIGAGEYLRPLVEELLHLLALLLPQLGIHCLAACATRQHLSHGCAVVNAAGEIVNTPDLIEPRPPRGGAYRLAKLERVTKHRQLRLGQQMREPADHYAESVNGMAIVEPQRMRL